MDVFFDISLLVYAAEQTVELYVILEAMTIMWRHFDASRKATQKYKCLCCQILPLITCLYWLDS